MPNLRNGSPFGLSGPHWVKNCLGPHVCRLFSYLLPWKLQKIKWAQQFCLIEQIHSYKTIFFDIFTTISYVFASAMNKCLHAVLVKTCTSKGDPLLPVLKCTTYCLTVLTSTVWSPEMFSKHQWMSVGAVFLLFVCLFVCFSVWRNSNPHLCFIRASMSDAILSDCPSAAICHTATEFHISSQQSF